MRPEELPEHYFPAVRERDIERFMALFALDAVMILPDGREVVGADAIREAELRVFASGAPVPQPAFVTAGVNSVAVEIDVHLPNGTVMKAANFYQLNADGLIKRLSTYRKV
jgi:ketosteroid isomerase-like protein